MTVDWSLLVYIGATSVLSALAGLALLALLSPHRRAPRRLADLSPSVEETVFLFDAQALIDASAPARALMDATPLRGSDWTRLCAFLGPRFRDFDAALRRFAETGQVEIEGTGSPALRLRAEMLSGLTRVTLVDPGSEGQAALIDTLSLRAMEEEIDELRETADAMPVLAWREDPDGEVIWANEAYLLQSGALAQDDDEPCLWPLPRLFDDLPDAGGTRRVRLDQGEGTRWFELSGQVTTHGTLNFAMTVDATVRAETALREFVQTLTKTFAHLPIGLAIFDRRRQLALFNPALTELTSLGPDFLSSRPTLIAFLDRLRDARMIPEPKDYRSWRQQMSALEAAASSGSYQETWPLPSGLTYRVTGRPHPDGAVALMIEDITAEVSLTRRFRAELELGQAVIDSMPEAIAVFSPAGTLAMSNSAYARMWGDDPSTLVGEIGAGEAVRLWQQQTGASPIWAEARDFILQVGRRDSWTGEAVLKTGLPIRCRFEALPGGSTLAGFLPTGSDAAQPRRLRRRREAAVAGTAEPGAPPLPEDLPRAADTPHGNGAAGDGLAGFALDRGRG